MIITLGRNKKNGKTTAVVEEKDGFSSFDKLVESIQLDDERINSIVEYYKRLKT